MREACRLITPQSVETCEYPLLWNLMFVPATRFVELDSDWQFEMAKRQAKFIGVPSGDRVGELVLDEFLLPLCHFKLLV